MTLPSDPPSDEVTHVVLICDEAGAKGYANRDEQSPGEVGVFAGLFAPVEKIAAVQADFDAVAGRYAGAAEKLHITALPPDQQHTLRNEMFGLIQRHRLPCFWEAIHVAGFHRVFADHRRLIESARAARRSPIKLRGNLPDPPSLHVALFQGLYSKALAFCMERHRLQLTFEVRIDTIDSPIVKNFATAATALLDYGAKIESVTGFDPATKKKVARQIVSTGTPKHFHLPIVVKELKLTVVDDGDGLALAADILANSLCHLFHHRSESELYSALNTVDAVQCHQLRDHLDTYWNWESYNFTDTYYAHPRDPIRTEDTQPQ